MVHGHPCPHGWGSRAWERRRPRRHGAVVWLVGRCRFVVRGHPCRHGWGGGDLCRGSSVQASGSVPSRRLSFHPMTMGRRGRRRSQDEAPCFPVNTLAVGPAPICGPRASLPASVGRRGRRRSQDDAPRFPVNPLFGGQVPICGPRSSLPAWVGRRGRRRSQCGVPPLPINPLIGGQVPICGPRASLPAWVVWCFTSLPSKRSSRIA